MVGCLRIAGVLIGLLLGSLPAQAQSVFGFSATLDGVTSARAFTGAESALRALESGDLTALFPGYTQNSALDATLNYRGVPMQFAFAADSTDLRVVIPSLGIDETFTGGTRDAAIDEMVEYVQKGKDNLAKLQRALAAQSAIEPIAGNPASLMSLMINEAFADDAFDERLIVGKGYKTNVDARLRPGAMKSLGLVRTNFDANGLDGSSWTAPFSFTFKPSSTTVVKFGLPMQFTDVDGAKTISGAFRMGVQTRVRPHWTITPSAAWGAAVSTDLGSMGHVLNFNLASRYEKSMGRYTLVFGNMVGYARTMGLSIGDYDFDPKLTNVILKNGVQAQMPVLRAFGRHASARVSYALSNYYGSDLYLDSVHEFGIGFGGGGSSDLPLAFEAKRIYGNDYGATSLGAVLRF